MSDINITAVILFISFIYIFILFIFSNFTYDILETSIKMKWKILKFILIGSRTIKIENIREVKKIILKKDLFSGGYIYGNVLKILKKNGVVIILKKRMFLIKKFFISPQNPDEFIEQLNKKIEMHLRLYR